MIVATAVAGRDRTMAGGTVIRRQRLTRTQAPAETTGGILVFGRYRFPVSAPRANGVHRRTATFPATNRLTNSAPFGLRNRRVQYLRLSSSGCVRHPIWAL